MPELRIRRAQVSDAQFGTTLTSITTAIGLGEVEQLSAELKDMTNVLLGRVPSPIDSPYLALQEVATAYHSRACELEMLIHELEREGHVHRGSAYYKFRTGELRDFTELAKRAAELGSRRLSQEQLLHNQRLESA